MKMTAGTGLTKLGAPEGVMNEHGFVFAPFRAALAPCLVLKTCNVGGIEQKQMLPVFHFQM